MDDDTWKKFFSSLAVFLDTNGKYFVFWRIEQIQRDYEVTEGNYIPLTELEINTPELEKAYQKAFDESHKVLKIIRNLTQRKKVSNRILKHFNLDRAVYEKELSSWLYHSYHDFETLDAFFSVLGEYYLEGKIYREKKNGKTL